MNIFCLERIVATVMQLVLSICKDENDTKIIDLILTHQIMSLLIYDES